MNRESALDKTYQRFMEICIKSISEDELDELAVSEIMGFGTAKDEIIKGVEEAKDLLRKQREQSRGLKIEYILKPHFRKINEKTNSAIIVDEIEIEMKSEDFNHQLLLRITTYLEIQHDEWKVVHWHGSIPQESTSADTWHIDEWKRKAEELQNLVDQKTTQLTQQNNELEIEAALERVRSTAMSMVKPEDLSTICEKIFLEMKGLGFKNLRNTEVILNQDEKENIRSYYYSDYGVTGVVDVDCKTHPTILKWFHDLQKQEDAFAEVIITRDQMEEWEEYRQSLGYVADPKLETEANVFYYSYATGSGALSISSFTSLELDDIEVLKRFRNVFNLAYKRYNDIQLAQQQAREAQIEAALERVRARSMAMHSSDELGEVAKVMFDQMQKLGGDLYAFGVVLCDKYEDKVEQWHGLGEAGMMTPFYVPIDLDYIHQYRYDQWKAGVELFSIEIPSDYIEKHFGLMFDLPSVKVVAEELATKGIELTIPPWEIDYGASFNHGYLLISSLKVFEEDHIFPRFAQVFEQAFTRFLDLQRAEANVREAQIETALESIRSRSLAVNKSDEFNEVVEVVFKKLGELSINIDSVLIALSQNGTKDLDVFGCGTNDSGLTILNFELPYYKNPFIDDAFEARKGSESGYYSKIYSEAEKNQYYDYALKNTELQHLPDDIKQRIRNSTQYALSVAYTKNSMIMLNDMGGKILSDDDADIIGRFSRVFEQAYIRFLDLKKAEAQVREAQIEAALERIRSRSMAMHKTEDLKGVVQVLFDEMQGLSVEMDFGSVSIFMFNEDNRDMTQWLPLPEGVQLLNIPYFEHPINSEIFKAKDRGDEFMAKVYPVEVKNSWTEKGFELTDYKDLPESFKTSILEAPGYSFTMTLAKNSGILIPNFEGKLLSEEDNEIMKRVGRVFEQSYIRFLDLKKAEAQTREAEIQLALERVRAASMAMYTSDELASVTRIFFEQLVTLEMDVQRSWIDIFHEEEGYILTWSTDFEGNFQPSPSKFPTDFKDETMVDFLADYKSPSRFIEMEAHGNEVKEWFDYLYETSSDPIFKISHVPNDLYQIWAKHRYGTVATTKLTPFTIEEKEVLARFANVFEQAYVRFLDLKIAEAQAKEAQIEAALEKVRSRTMAMQNSDELREVANVIDVQTRSLGINLWSVSYNILSEDKKSCICIPSSEGQMQAAFTIPFEGEKSFVEWMNAIDSGETFYVQELEGKDLEEHYAYLMTLPGIEAAVDPLEEAGISLPTYQINHLCLFNDGILLFITYEKVPEAHDIFKRFTQVFEQTYTRFLDLKNAEAQAREAQIEAAMERIRSRSLAMRSSEEIKDVMIEVRRQIDNLGQLDLEASVVHLYEKDNPMFESIAAVRPPGESGDIVLANVFFPVDAMDRIKEMVKLYWSDTNEYTLEFNKELAEEWQQVMVEYAPMIAERRVGFVKNRRISDNPEYWNFADFSEGSLLLVTHSPASEDTKTVLRKASQVFDLAYRRFRDLQKAEARAREAKIEAALEKVRSRSMGMQSSEEMEEVIKVVYAQMVDLDIFIEHTGFIMDIDTRDDMLIWLADPNGVQPQVTLPYFDTPHWNSYLEAKKQGNDLFVNQFDFDEKNEFYNKLFQFIPNIPEEARDFYLKCDGLAISTVLVDNVGLYMENFKGTPYSDEDNEILLRFGKVFQQTYTRFLDLKKAEEQTRQARIETALERVRARAMAMQEPEELKEVAQVLRTEMGMLDIKELETCSIYIKDVDSSKAECWYAIKDIRDEETILVKDQFALDFNDTWVGREMMSFYESEQDRVSIVMKGDHRKEWIEYCAEHSDALDGYYGEVIPERTYHLYKFSNGSIGFASAGDISEESWNILARAASAFSLAYSRFQDLTRARQDLIQLKEEKKRAEDALSELKEAQKQLIHAEKMASLGELTAGIAHEIQNPLNFVNNFSEVSHEMIEEVKEELKDGDPEEAEALLKDITTNLEKIAHHGQRASGIVRSMLDHSRASGGEKVVTDLNALCDEYLRLAYHGMRAKDRNFNAELVTSFDESLPKVKVIPQDIGRVLLNLINNAFQAVSEAGDLTGFPDNKHKTNPEDPNSLNQSLTSNLAGLGTKIKVTTKNLGDKIKITVSDNGPGIPKNIKDKIFQPFFTTKPTGQGTGLGLSLSYDIVKAHGGELIAESEPEEGTTFIIRLPLKTHSE